MVSQSASFLEILPCPLIPEFLTRILPQLLIQSVFRRVPSEGVLLLLNRGRGQLSYRLSITQVPPKMNTHKTTYFFRSIMFPTIFALGIFGLGQRAKKASSFLVMAIMGGAILPKVMGATDDMFDLSRSFIVPMVCFAFIAVYAFMWPRLSGSEGLHGITASEGH
jgi:hypothetical protein